MRIDDIVKRDGNVDVGLLIDYMKFLDKRVTALEKENRQLRHDIINVEVDCEEIIRKLK